MALKGILDLIASEHGIDTNNEAQRALTLAWINKAAEELYRMTDLDGALGEMIVSIDAGTQQITLPSNIEQVRGGRYYESRDVITQDNIVNRYQSPGYSNDTWYLKFRKKARSPLQKMIDNQSILKFSIPVEEDTVINLSVQGPTDRAVMCRETLQIAAGQTSVNSTENFKTPLASLRKDRITTYDITIKDVNDNILGTIPNNQLFAQYIVWQILDTEYSGSFSYAGSVELLYKKPFIPFLEDFDQFLDSDKYDLAIIAKFNGLRSQNSEAFVLSEQKANQSMRIAHDDGEPGDTSRKLTFPISPFYDLPYNNL